MSEIVIRHVETTDAQALHHLYSQTPVYRDTLQLPLPSVESGRSASPIPNQGTHNPAAFIDGQLAGQLAVMLNQRVRRRHVATFGIGVDPRYHGKGVGSRLMQAMIDLCDNWAAIEAHRADGVHRQPGGHGAVPQIRFRDRGHQPRLCHARRRIGRRLPYGAFALRAAARRCVIVPIRRGRCAGPVHQPPNLLQALAGLTAAVGIFSPLTPLGAAMPTSAAGRPQPDYRCAGPEGRRGARQPGAYRHNGYPAGQPGDRRRRRTRRRPRHRETDALGEDNLVQTVDALTFSGGSVYGRRRRMASRPGWGNRAEATRCARPRRACLPYRAHRLPVRSGQRWRQNWQLTPPYRQLGIDAVGKAGLDFPLGTVGAGYGAMTGMGKLKGGLGSASIIAANGATVGALVAVNSWVRWSRPAPAPSGRPYEIDGEFGNGGAAALAQLRAQGEDWMEQEPQGGRRTPPAACIATDALTRVELKRVAIMAQDGMARAIRPLHSPFDGDVVFALSTGQREVQGSRELAVLQIGALAADTRPESPVAYMPPRRGPAAVAT